MKDDCVDNTVVGPRVVDKSPVVYISVVPGRVFVIGPIEVVAWMVLFIVE